MDKNVAANAVANSGMSTYDIANSIFQATVLGVSGANQNNGYGFNLSAIAELYNIRGTVNNSNAGRTKITNRYRGMNITEDMILNVVQQYPNGIRGYSPLFDDLLGVGNEAFQNFDDTRTEYTQKSNTSTGSPDYTIVIVTVALILACRLFLGWNWIVSIIVALAIGGLIDSKTRR